MLDMTDARVVGQHVDEGLIGIGRTIAHS